MPTDIATRLTPEEQAAMTEGRAATAAVIQRMNSGAARFMQLADLKAVDGKTVTMTIPRSFILTLDDHRQVKFNQGIAEVPVEVEVIVGGKTRRQKISEEWYVKNNGCKAYDGARTTAAAATSVIVGGSSNESVKIGDQEIPATVIAKSAFDLSGLTADGWNALPADHRDDLIKNEIRRRNILIAAGTGKAGDKTGKKGAGGSPAKQ